MIQTDSGSDPTDNSGHPPAKQVETDHWFGGKGHAWHIRGRGGGLVCLGKFLQHIAKKKKNEKLKNETFQFLINKV